jgi:hypothetical protein
MFLRCKVRKKNGKEHRNWSLVENRRVAGGIVVQRHVLYLGEINDSQQLAWRQPASPPLSRAHQLQLPQSQPDNLLSPHRGPHRNGFWKQSRHGRRPVRLLLGKHLDTLGSLYIIWLRVQGPVPRNLNAAAFYGSPRELCR